MRDKTFDKCMVALIGGVSVFVGLIISLGVFCAIDLTMGSTTIERVEIIEKQYVPSTYHTDTHSVGGSVSTTTTFDPEKYILILRDSKGKVESRNVSAKEYVVTVGQYVDMKFTIGRYSGRRY